MIKNLGKFKQWTGEKFGGAKVTLQTEDFQRLEQETEHRREGYDNVVKAVEMIQSHLLKKKTSPEDSIKNKVMPFEALGSCLYHYGTVFPDDSALGIALINLGQTETRIAALQEALANDIKNGYMTTLDNGLQEYKEYDVLRKKLASRRLDYDSKLNRLNKAKKEKPELEQEMQASRIKYEDTEHDLIQKMAYIQEFENEYRDALLNLVEAQSNYHNQAKELLETIKSNWGQGSTSDPRDMMGNVMARLSLSNESLNSISKDHHYRSSIIHQQQPHRTPESSTDDYNSGTSQNYSFESIQQPTQLPPTTTTNTATNLTSESTPRQLSSHEFIEKYRKALFDFTGQNNDEISFRTGDVIVVIDEIDKGWWLGEVHSKKGIFPVNYTEEYDPQTHTLPPLPAKVSVLEEQPPEPQIYHSSSRLPAIISRDIILPPPVINTTAIRQNPPLPSASSSPIVPTIRSTSLSRNRSTAIRAPPPPPAVRVNSLESFSGKASPILFQDSPQQLLHDTRLMDDYIKQSASSSPPLHHGDPLNRPMSPLPPQRPSQQLIESKSSSPRFPQQYYGTESLVGHHPTRPPPKESYHRPIHCIECECHDFIENLFKKGHCNNCFHKHE